MIWIIVPIVLGLIAAVYFVRQEVKAIYGEPFSALVFTVMGTIFATALIAMAGNGICSTFLTGEPEEYASSKLLALNDSSSTSGSFFLGSGSFDEEPAFFFYQQGERGATLEHVDADVALIIEEDIKQPYISFTRTTTENRFWYIGGTETNYEFHIPKGSITNSYVLDAE